MTQPLPPDFDFMEAEEIAPPPKRKMKPGVKTAILCLVLLTAVAVVLLGPVSRIRTIEVYGNNRFTPEQVQQIAGVRDGIRYFTVTEKYLQEHFAENHRLIYLGMKKSWPGTLEIYITERYERANLEYQTQWYLLEENGLVMEKAKDNALNPALPVVTGIQPRSVTVGKEVAFGNEEQMKCYQAIMAELLEQGCLGEIAELNVSNPENLFLITREKNYFVTLGDVSALRAKIGTARAVARYLKANNYTEGIIDVSITKDDASAPIFATYTPQ